MEKRSIGRRIWETLGPILIKMGVAMAVETVILTFYFMQYMPELMELVTDTEAFMNRTMELTMDAYEYIVEITAIASLITIPILMIMKRKDAIKDQSAGIVPNKKAPLYRYIFIVGVSIPLAILANNLITLSDLAQYSEAYQQTAETLYGPSLPVQIVCLGIIAPICEEYVFRGLIFKRMRRYRGFVGAMLSSSFIFGIYHMNGVQFLYATICGLLLAFLYEKYGSLKAPILAHVLMNTVICVMSNADAFTWMFSKPIRMALITIACAAIGSSVFLLIRQIDEKPEMVEVVKGETE